MAQNHLEDLLSDASFVRWIRGEAAQEEELKWNAWLESDPNHQKFVEEAKDVILAFQKEENRVPEISREWQRLERLIDQEEDQNKVLSKSIDMHLPHKKSSILVTALLIIGISLGVFAVFQHQFTEESDGELASNPSSIQEYRTDFGEKATFRLSDDSRIVLNANSHIRFSSGLESGKNVTEVWLEGEAWFDITHFEDERRRTFTVHTDDGSVEVLGTRFVVKTLENETRTVLDEGKIQVFTHAHQTRPSLSQSQIPGEGGQAGTTVLKPGEMALYSTDSGSVAVEKVNSRIYTSWSEDIWFFEDTPLTEIARRIEDTFGLEVEIKDELADRVLSGSIKGTDVKVLAEALSKILDAEIQQRDQKLFIDEKNTH